MRIILLASILTIFFSACQSNEAVQQELVREIMVIHDDVMPKMDNIHQVQKQLRAKKGGVANTLIKKNIDDHIEALEGAGEGMMEWMADLKLPSTDDTRTHEEIMMYLEQQKVEIQHVSDDMLGSIAAGKELLETLK